MKWLTLVFIVWIVGYAGMTFWKEFTVRKWTIMEFLVVLVLGSLPVGATFWLLRSIKFNPWVIALLATANLICGITGAAIMVLMSRDYLRSDPNQEEQLGYGGLIGCAIICIIFMFIVPILALLTAWLSDT